LLNRLSVCAQSALFFMSGQSKSIDFDKAMAHLEEEANALVEKAQKKLKSFSFFSDKHEDAVELLSRAANLYKQAKRCT
jgi:hypothetical protein